MRDLNAVFCPHPYRPGPGVYFSMLGREELSRSGWKGFCHVWGVGSGENSLLPQASWAQIQFSV